MDASRENPAPVADAVGDSPSQTEKDLQSQPFPQNYVVTKKCRVRAGKALDSQEIQEIDEKTPVTVEEVNGRRARISKPVAGWMSWRQTDGTILFAQAVKQLQQVGEKVLMLTSLETGHNCFVEGEILAYNDKLGLFHVQVVQENVSRRECWLSPDSGSLHFLGPDGMKSLPRAPREILGALHPALKERFKIPPGPSKDDPRAPSRSGHSSFGHPSSFAHPSSRYDPRDPRDPNAYGASNRGYKGDPRYAQERPPPQGGPHQEDPFRANRHKDQDAAAQAMLFEKYVERRGHPDSERRMREAQHERGGDPRMMERGDPRMMERPDPRMMERPDPRMDPRMMDRHAMDRHAMHPRDPRMMEDPRHHPDPRMRDPRMDPRRDPRYMERRGMDPRMMDPRNDPRYEAKMREAHQEMLRRRDPRARGGDPRDRELLESMMHSKHRGQAPPNMDPREKEKQIYEYYLSRRKLEQQQRRAAHESRGGSSGYPPRDPREARALMVEEQRRKEMERRRMRPPGTPPAPGERQLIILRGFPGAGKTMLAKQITEGFGGHTLVCSEDRYHWTGGDVGKGEFIFKPDINWQTRDWCAREVIDALRDGVPLIIVDNINYRIIHYEEHIRAASQLGYSVKIMEIVHSPELIPKFRARCKLNLAEEEWMRLNDKWETDPRVQLLYPSFMKEEAREMRSAELARAHKSHENEPTPTETLNSQSLLAGQARRPLLGEEQAS